MASRSVLSRIEGEDFFTAADTLLKGALESEAAIHLIVGSRRAPLPGLFAAALDEGAVAVRRDHGLEIASCPDGARAVALAEQAARSRRNAVALVANDDLDAALPAIERFARVPFAGEGAACLLLEDAPGRQPTACPRVAMRRLGLASVEPADLAGLRDALEHAIRLSRACERPTGLIVHESLLRTADTLLARPNRVVGPLEMADALRQRRRGPRLNESLSLLRLARRLELNVVEAMPSPGERAALGFIAVGPARTAVRHVLQELQLAGRVPVLHLGLVHPLDEAVIERMLMRCEETIILEPRPGSVGAEVAALAERLRRRGVVAGLLWWDQMPPENPPGDSGAGRETLRDVTVALDGDAERLTIDEALRPSALARKALHVLHDVRPGLRIATRLAAIDAESFAVNAPPRAAQDAGAVMLSSLLGEVDRWSRERPLDEEEGVAPTMLAIDGVAPAEGPSRRVIVERWDRMRFAREGPSAVRHAARDAAPRVLLVLDGGEDTADPERLARAVVPGERGERVRFVAAALDDRVELRDALRAAVLFDGLTVLTIRTLAGIREGGAASIAEVDRLGFQPVQRLVWSAELACDLRPSLPRLPSDAGAQRFDGPLRHQVRIERGGAASVLPIRVRLRPLLEQIEVVRTRPPAPAGRVDFSMRLAPPRPAHGGKGLWRAHLAGVRGGMPGVATRLLCDAGRTMGYHVRCLHDDTPIGPGRGAWAQVLFTRPRADEAPAALSVQIPYGEADMLLGLDALETLRAIGPDSALRVAAADRCAAVANSGALDDQLDAGVDASRDALAATLPRVCLPEQALLIDIAQECRSEFLTDRVADLVLVGVAFQRGLIPLSLEAIEQALRRLESEGVGRATESFAFGRQIGAGARFVARHGSAAGEETESIDRLVRWIGLEINRRRPRRRAEAREFMALLMESLQRMPGLSETIPGRETRRDFAISLRRCLAWGGLDHARRYAGFVVDLYDADRGDAGRELTRFAVLPLSDAFLPRDLVYMAAMATSLDHRRRTRERLGVRLARGDQMHRRYLNRLDLSAFGWRVRVDFRTSDWPARVVATFGPYIPWRDRGSPLDRAIRDYVSDLVRRATAAADGEYRRWVNVMRRLHAQAEINRLRGVTVESLRERVEAEV